MNYSAKGALNIINHLDIRQGNKEEESRKTVAFDSSIITAKADFPRNSIVIFYCNRVEEEGEVKI